VNSGSKSSERAVPGIACIDCPGIRGFRHATDEPRGIVAIAPGISNDKNYPALQRSDGRDASACVQMHRSAEETIPFWRWSI